MCRYQSFFNILNTPLAIAIQRSPTVTSVLTKISVLVERTTRGFDVSPDTEAPLMPEGAVEELRGALPQLVVETVPDTNHFTVNFGTAGVTVLAEAVRKALR